VRNQPVSDGKNNVEAELASVAVSEPGCTLTLRRPQLLSADRHVWRFANTYEVLAVKKWATPRLLVAARP
jgi:hypothetical protein